MKAVQIHCLVTWQITTIKIGDNEAWEKLSRLDQSMIEEVLKHGQLVTCGKTIYEPIFMTKDERAKLQEQYEEVFSETEISDPVGYGEVLITPEDFLSPTDEQ